MSSVRQRSERHRHCYRRSLCRCDISAHQYTAVCNQRNIHTCRFFGVFGNLLSLTIICTHPPIRKRLPNYSFVNQTLADLLVCILLVPYSTTPLCLIWQSRALLVGLYDVSVYSIVALSVERCLEVVYPIWHKLNVTKVKVKVTIIFIWIFGITYKYSYLLPGTRAVNGVCIIYEYYGSSPLLSSASARGVLNSFVDIIFPLFVIFLCYILMWRELRNKVKPHGGPTTQSIGTTSINASISRARRNILTILVIVVAFLIACNSYTSCVKLLARHHD